MSTPTPVPEPTTADLEATFQPDLFQPLAPGARCDADSAEAAVAQVLMPSGTVLLFCGSHFRRNYAELSKLPHQVPDAEAKPFTERRAQELGGPQSRSQGDDHA